MFILEQIALCLPLRARYLDDLSANPTLLNSRSALKKYILANNKNIAQGPTFDTQFNRAIKTGVEKGEFAQPKGRSPFLSHFALYEPQMSESFCLVVDLIVYVYRAPYPRRSCCCRCVHGDRTCFHLTAH